jgi:hypothetical protein
VGDNQPYSMEPAIDYSILHAQREPRISSRVSQDKSGRAQVRWAKRCRRAGRRPLPVVAIGSPAAVSCTRACYQVGLPLVGPREHPWN